MLIKRFGDLDSVKDHDCELNNWYDEVHELYEKIRLRYEK